MPIPEDLVTGPLFAFRDWPNAPVPKIAAGVYTVWRGEELVYAGMSGRSLTTDMIAEHRAANKKEIGLYTRLDSHAEGRRSGDQFCVYVADRFVLRMLTPEQIECIADDTLSFDALVRTFIHENLRFRFVEAPDGKTAYEWESAIKRGELAVGPPLLNPARKRPKRERKRAKPGVG
jgi:hypothetical protein